MNAEPDIAQRLEAALKRLDAAMAGLADTMDRLGAACIVCCDRATALIDDLDAIASGAARADAEDGSLPAG